MVWAVGFPGSHDSGDKPKLAALLGPNPSTIRQVHELLQRQIGRLVSFEDRQDSFRRRKDKRQVRLNIRPRKLLVESLVLIDDFDYLAFRIKNGADSACPVVLF